MPEVDRPVQRRHVFFFSGFDPKGASYYHRIYREQALLQGALMGVRYTVGGSATSGADFTPLSGIVRVPVGASCMFAR